MSELLIEKGIEQGIERGRIETLADLIKDGVLTITEAAKRVGISEVLFTEKMNQYKG